MVRRGASSGTATSPLWPTMRRRRTDAGTSADRTLRYTRRGAGRHALHWAHGVFHAGKVTHLAQLLVLSSTHGAGPVLPSLELLSHRVRQIPAEPASLVNAPSADVIFVDARVDLVGAKSLCKILNTTGLDAPLLLVVTEGGLTAVSTDWGVDDVILVTAGPAEVDARVRLAIGRQTAEQVSTRIQTSGISIDESSYSAKVHGKPLDLTYKEFQLLHFFATHPSRVFTREQLLSEVWGYDYFGGTRTVDVHVRRLRAKLGDLEQLIGTVRNVGYRFNVYEDDQVPAPRRAHRRLTRRPERAQRDERSHARHLPLQ